MSHLARHNFHQESEAGVNKQINKQLHASYVYLSVAFYFDRDDVALQGFHKFFKELSDKERSRAEKLMCFQNKRGGRIVMQDIQKPNMDEWGSPLEVMQNTLDFEKGMNQTALDLHSLAEKHKDEQMADFLEEEFLHYRVESIKKISNHISQLKRVDKGLGEFYFDKQELS